LFALLTEGVRAYRLTSGDSEPGTIYIPQQEGLDLKLAAIADKFPIDIHAASSTPAGDALLVHLPRIGLYQSWVPSMDEGWTRWIFDQNGIPYTRLVDADIRKGNLNQQFDVVLIPDNSPRAITTGRGGYGGESSGGPAPEPTTGNGGGAQKGAGTANARGARTSPGDEVARGPQIPPEFRGGLGEDGVASLKAFTEAGGTIVTLNKASEIYTEKEASKVVNGLDTVDRKAFFIPGSILQVSVDPTNPIAFGSSPTVPIFYENGPTFRVNGDAHSVAFFATDKPLLSGWILGGQFLKGTSVIAEEPVGKGRIILFGFRPQYRAQSEVTYKFLFNALLYSSSQPALIGNSSASLSSKGGE
jgi:hypothetical protein